MISDTWTKQMNISKKTNKAPKLKEIILLIRMHSVRVSVQYIDFIKMAQLRVMS